VAAIVVGVVGWLGAKPKLEQVSPQRVRVGQRATLTGTGFSDEATGNTVVFGAATAKVVSASSTRIDVEVPEAVVEAGAERRVAVVVKRGERESEPIEISVFAGPNLHGLSPDVAMPGEEVLLAGAGWGLGATVRFGDLAAQVLEVDPTQIRVIVPPLPDVSGTPAPVVVTVGGVESNPAPFFVGRLPLVTGVAPTAASIGDVLKVSGRGFQRDAAQNDVRIAGVAALVVSASDDELQVVVPRQPAGEPARPLEVRVPGSEEIGRAIIQVTPAPDPIRLDFVAEPFPSPPESPHAVVSTGIGPAFVFSAANGRSAAQRALAAQQRLNEAVATLVAAPTALPEARDLATRPVVSVAGYPEAILEVTAADAAAYNEDWTRLRGRGGPVTPARLARWWEAVYRDLVLMLLRGERPRFAAALAPEGRALQQVFDAGQRTGGAVSRQTVAGIQSSVRNGLRVVALRVPASVTSEAAPPPAAAPSAPAAAPTPQAEPLELEGTWTGSETEGGRRRYITVTFRRSEGTISYEGGITLTVPFLSYDKPGRDRVRFAVQIRGGMRHYHGQWDGETLSGNLTRDQAGSNVVGTFELRKR
jgi:putative intracellular protease/amidase